MTPWQKLLCLALAGAAGTLARYSLAGVVQKLAGAAFPWGTVSVNLIGCFLFGLFWALGGERSVISAEARLLILTGFMGAFTTFSTFVSESSQLLADAQWLTALTNIALQNVVGIAVFFLGLILGRWI